MVIHENIYIYTFTHVYTYTLKSYNRIKYIGFKYYAFHATSRMHRQMKVNKLKKPEVFLMGKMFQLERVVGFASIGTRALP